MHLDVGLRSLNSEPERQAEYVSCFQFKGHKKTKFEHLVW